MNWSYKAFTIFIICMTVVGCYTMLKHPHLSDALIVQKEYLDKDVNHLDDCKQCHTRDDRFFPPSRENYHAFIWNDDHFYEWNYYYARHWWYDDSYYAPEIDENDILPPTLPRYMSDENHSYPTSTVSPPAVSNPTSLGKQLADSTQNAAPARQKESKTRVMVRRQESGGIEKKKVITDKSDSQDNHKD